MKSKYILQLSILAVTIGIAFVIGRTTRCNVNKSAEEVTTITVVSEPSMEAPEPPQTTHPDYEFFPESISVGNLREGQATTHVVELRRPADTPIRIARLYTTCPCLQVSARKMIVPAGEPVKLDLSFHSLTAHGDKKVTFVAELMEPEKIIIKGEVTAQVKRVPAKLLIQNDKLHFGTVKESKKVSTKIYNLTKQSVTIEGGEIDGLTVELSASRIAPGKSVTLSVTASNKTLKPGALKGDLKIKTSLPEHAAMEIPVDGTVR